MPPRKTMEEMFGYEQKIISSKNQTSNINQQKGQEAIPTGKVNIKEYRSYYDINNTITTALASNPNNPEHSSYNTEPIFQHNQRNAEKIYVANDGSDTLFVTISHSGVEHSTRERPIYPGDVKTYYNVFELRLRSPTAGVSYRVSEYEIERTSAGTSLPGSSAPAPTTLFNGQKTVAVVGTQEQLNANTPCQYVFIKALPTNTGFVYVGISTVSSSDGYILDGADDAIALAIDNLNKIWIDVSVAGEGVSYIGAN